MSSPDMEQIAQLHALDEVMTNLSVYQDPKMLIDELSKRIDNSKVDQKALKCYQQLLLNIKYAWGKTKKYEKYFSVFYPQKEQIGEIEALNHHIHAYLQDMDTFKNKIETLLNALKQDILRIASNKDEIRDAFQNLSNYTYKTFLGVSQHRNPHTHQGMRFIDGDLLKAENAFNASAMIQSPPLALSLNQTILPEIISKFEKEKRERFDAAKARWIHNAKINNEQTSGFLNQIIRNIESSIYKLLRIVPLQIILPEFFKTGPMSDSSLRSE